uniref:Uncharacterized protein n=1 Tax=Aegilops tauschii subsp. strangulata TaxID=200361 RepID=A0A453RNY6_AEGTS
MILCLIGVDIMHCTTFASLHRAISSGCLDPLSLCLRIIVQAFAAMTSALCLMFKLLFVLQELEKR